MPNILLAVNGVINESVTLPSARQKTLGKEPDSGSASIVNGR
jgi:hypothetical protein